MNKKLKVNLLWFGVCFIFTGLTLVHQYLFYLFFFGSALALAIPAVLEAARLISIPSMFVKKLRVAFVIYFGVALMSVSVNLLQFHREVRQKNKEVAQSLEVVWQNLANRMVQKINFEIKGEKGQRLENFGVLEVDPGNKKVIGKDKFRISQLSELNEAKDSIFSNKPEGTLGMKLEIAKFRAELGENQEIGDPGMIDGLSGEIHLVGDISVSETTLYFVILSFLTMLIELCIYMSGKRAFTLVDVREVPGATGSRIDGELVKRRKRFDAFLVNDSCRNWFSQIGQNSVDTDKKGFPRIGIKGVRKDDRPLVKEFRTFLGKNKEFTIKK